MVHISFFGIVSNLESKVLDYEDKSFIDLNLLFTLGHPKYDDHFK